MADGESNYFVSAARRAVAAAEEAFEAATSDPQTPSSVYTLTKKAVEESRALLSVVESSPRTSRQRQSFAEFTTLLSEEVVEAGAEKLIEAKRNAERTMRKAKSLIEDHFHIDEAFRMLGPLSQDSNLARDVHDWFNLIALLPVIIFDCINWGCAPGQFCGLFTPPYVTNLWHGEAFQAFWWTTFSYFVIDLGWMFLLPNCVRSPGVIVKHHVATLGYICVPYLRPEYGWLMGACMIVEVNTWFLIARRSFNKKGDKPFTTGVPLSKSLRLLIVSTCFYVTWFVIRLFIYPVLLLVILNEWWKYSVRVGTPLNLIAITPIMQCVFIFLNIKWTIDLIRSKLKSKGPTKGL
mmetsp:Transcript_15887/g.43532  ORF Transcript_15887/g.43532 Transcript_15887/m.43532 type:complete len:350 (+) Transcript_15887:55-1104(+)